MKIGIGLPSTVPGASPSILAEWVRAAEAGPFASVALDDRVLSDSWEAMVTLAAAAALSERLLLACLVAPAPARPAAILAKEAATVNGVSGGRLVLGLGRQLLDLDRLWSDPRLGATPPALLVDELPDAPLARIAGGYIHRGEAAAFGAAAERVMAAWTAAGRNDQPQLWAAAAAGPAIDVHALARHYSSAGCDHLLLFPATAEPDEVRRLSEAAATT